MPAQDHSFKKGTSSSECRPREQLSSSSANSQGGLAAKLAQGKGDRSHSSHKKAASSKIVVAAGTSQTGAEASYCPKLNLNSS